MLEGEVQAVVGCGRSFHGSDDVGAWIPKVEQMYLGDGEFARAGVDGKLLAHVTAVRRDEQAPVEASAGSRVVTVCAELLFGWAGDGCDASVGAQVRGMEG